MTATCSTVKVTAFIVASVSPLAAVAATAAEPRLRADLWIRDPFILPVAETKTYRTE